MKEKMRKWKGAVVASGVVALLGTGIFSENHILKSTVQATEKDANGFYENDVTPPWGRIVIQGAREVDSVNYVDRQEVVVEIYAADDMCADEEIKYYLSQSEISDTTKIADSDWKSYTTGKTETITLNSTSSMNTIYAVFKDHNGNTSLIYTGSALEQTINYNANATDATMPTGMASKRMHGAPFVVTSQTPKRTGYFFRGWALTANATTPSFYAGDIIPADMSLGNGSSATLYAVWTQTVNELVTLADVVNVGDYVNYPVYYDNVNGSTLKGWRVISKDVDIDGNTSVGTVNLVSAGVPMTYVHGVSAEKSVTNLAINFLNTIFHTSDAGTYRKTGFNANQTLEKIFTNKYTATYTEDTSVTYSTYYTYTTTATKTKGTLKVRAMTKEDIMKATGINDWSTIISSGLSADKYDKLYKTGSTYWLASGYSSSSGYGSNLYYVDGNGYVYNRYNSYEYGVRPVVSLKSNVKASGTDSLGAWNIEI